MSKAIIFMADGMEMCECLITVDLLRRAGVQVTTASIMGRYEVTSSHKVTIKADELVEEADFAGANLIVLPGGRIGTENLLANELVMNQVRYFADPANGKLIAAICAAPSILASIGVLEGKKATCHPDFEGKMGTAILNRDKVVVNGNIVMGQALGATFDFALTLAEILEGAETARKVAAGICY